MHGLLHSGWPRLALVFFLCVSIYIYIGPGPQTLGRENPRVVQLTLTLAKLHAGATLLLCKLQCENRVHTSTITMITREIRQANKRPYRQFVDV